MMLVGVAKQNSSLAATAFTTTTAVAVSVLVAFLAVIVYVVVAVGWTVVLPVALTVPTPLIVIVSALMTFHESCEVWPVVIDCGLEMKDRICTAGLLAVVMRTRAFDTPPKLSFTCRRKT